MINRKNKKRTIRRDRRPKICRFCESKINYIDFLDADLLTKFQTENGKILAKRVTGTCKDHQKMLGAAIKKARILSLVL